MSRSFLTNLNLNKNQLLNASIQPLSQAPQNPVVGQIYFDTSIEALRQWTGTAWIDYLSSADGNQFIESVGSNLDVTNQQLTLGSKVVIDDASQTLTNKELGSGTTLGADLSGANAYKVTNLVDPTSNQDAATKAYVDTAVSNLVDGAPALLDTLNELAAAIGDDENFATTITSSIGEKVAKSGDTMTGALVLSGDPTEALQAATKQYVDNSISNTKYAANNGALSASGGAVTWVVTHNLGSTDVLVQVKEIASKATVEVDVEITDTNTVTLSWVSAGVLADTYRVVVAA